LFRYLFGPKPPKAIKCAADVEQALVVLDSGSPKRVRQALRCLGEDVELATPALAKIRELITAKQRRTRIMAAALLWRRDRDPALLQIIWKSVEDGGILDQLAAVDTLADLAPLDTCAAKEFAKGLIHPAAEIKEHTAATAYLLDQGQGEIVDELLAAIAIGGGTPSFAGVFNAVTGGDNKIARMCASALAQAAYSDPRLQERLMHVVRNPQNDTQRKYVAMALGMTKSGSESALLQNIIMLNEMFDSPDIALASSRNSIMQTYVLDGLAMRKLAGDESKQTSDALDTSRRQTTSVDNIPSREIDSTREQMNVTYIQICCPNPECERKYRVKTAFIGKKVTCNTCGQLFVVQQP